MNLVLVSLDAVWGQDVDVLQKLPHLGPLFQKGLRCRRVQTVYPTITYPVHVSMVTGVTPRIHGIGHNQPFDAAKDRGLQPEFIARIEKAGLPLDACRPWHWDHHDIAVPTLFDACKKAGKQVCSILWPVTGKHRGIRWNFPEVLAMPWENQTLKMLRYGSPLWLLKTELKYGKQRKSTQEPWLSDYGTLLAVSRLEKKKIPHLTALHLVDCDAMRHHHGVHSAEAMEALRRLDNRVGQILDALKRSGHDQDTALLIVSDHGQEDVSTPICLTEALKTNGFHAQAQSLGRGAYIHAHPDYPDEINLIYHYFAQHKQALGIAALYDEAAIAAMGGPEKVRLAVDAAEGVVFTDGLSDAKREKATHGFGPEHAAAQCLMSLTGPGIPDRELDAMHVTDIAALAARLLQVPWPADRGSSPL